VNWTPGDLTKDHPTGDDYLYPSKENRMPTEAEMTKAAQIRAATMSIFHQNPGVSFAEFDIKAALKGHPELKEEWMSESWYNYFRHLVEHGQLEVSNSGSGTVNLYSIGSGQPKPREKKVKEPVIDSIKGNSNLQEIELVVSGITIKITKNKEGAPRIIIDL
jgi:hypothetical protein